MEIFILVFVAFCAPVGVIAQLIGCMAPLFSGNWRRRARLYRLWGALGIAEFVLALLWVIDVYGSDGIDSGAASSSCWDAGSRSLPLFRPRASAA